MTTHRQEFDPYLRIVDFFDKDETAGSFLREDGDGGFVGAVYRMAREIDRLRSPSLAPADNGLVGRLREWAGSYEEGSFDTEESLMRQAADTITAQAAEIERLKAERGEALQDHMREAYWRNHYEARLSALEALLDKAVEGLEFYGDVAKYPAPLTGGMGALWSDCGERARSTLTEIQEARHAGE